MKELKNRDIPYKIYLSEDEMPRYWYNVRADMKNKPAPLLNPGTLKPVTAEDFAALAGKILLILPDQDFFSGKIYPRVPGAL